MTKPDENAASLSTNEQLRRCAARTREAEQLVLEADAEVERLRKELKQARKACRKAKRDAKEAAKAARKARAELSECLGGAFRQLAMALQGATALPAKVAANEPEAITPAQGYGKGEGLSPSRAEAEPRAAASG